jgi:hypothetical protein
MKHFKLISSVILSLSFTSCAGTPPKRAKLNSEKAIQTLQVYGPNYVYAQDDVILENNFHLDMVATTPEWTKDIRSTNRYKVGAFVTSLFSLGSIIACLSVDSDLETSKTAFCASAAGLTLISFPLSNRAAKYQKKSVDAFNKQFEAN